LTDEYKAEILARQALKRLIMPEEIANLVHFLASDDSSGITNQSFVIDGRLNLISVRREIGG
jgi:NAD(P)-dependent dehydrogenase (short-subunit alcohol dehydrogenase family)